MDKPFIRDRLIQLKLSKEISARQLSFELGHSDGYVSGIINSGKLPSYEELFYICEYFGITVADFFNEELENPILVRRVTELAKELKEEDLNAVITVMEQLLKKKEQKQPR